MRAHHHAARETAEVELLVGRVRIVVGQGQTEKQCVRAENFFEVGYDGN